MEKCLSVVIIITIILLHQSKVVVLRLIDLHAETISLCCFVFLQTVPASVQPHASTQSRDGT